jgi:hypothetical protein
MCQLCDTRGFGDPNENDYVLWTKLLGEMQNSFDGKKLVDMVEDGIAAIIVPVMMPLSMRIEASQTHLVYDILMTFTYTSKFRPKS